MWTKAHSSRPLESKSRGEPTAKWAGHLRGELDVHVALRAAGSTWMHFRPKRLRGGRADCQSVERRARKRRLQGAAERTGTGPPAERLCGRLEGGAGRGGRCAALKRTVMPAVVLSRLVQRTCAAPPSRPRALPRPPPRAHTHSHTIHARTRTAMSTASEHDQAVPLVVLTRAHSRTATTGQGRGGAGPAEARHLHVRRQARREDPLVVQFEPAQP